MREIRFRAWDTKTNSMHDGIWFWVSGTGEFWDNSDEKYNTPNTEINPRDGYILMQYTNLKDKNGREIYEGDIIDGEIEVDDNVWQPRLREVVEWDETVTGFGLNNSDKHEVVGNVYENPELVKL